MRTTPDVTRTIWMALGGRENAVDGVAFTGDGQFEACYRVTDLAAATVACAALSVAELLEMTGARAPSVTVDRRLASFWFKSSLRPDGWKVPPQWDAIAGDYAAHDGWIRLHTNAPHHRAAALRVLGDHADKAGIAKAVAQWDKQDLEAAVVAAGGCAAEMRSAEEWAAHPQGRAVGMEPLAHVEAAGEARISGWRSQPDRPLAGVKVLDLTRVLAGPVASRFLAGFGAEVLRIDPPWWEEPAVVPEMTVGKRCARLDLREAPDRARFEKLLAGADILLHGYRPGALESVGYGPEVRRALAPGLIDLALCAYGWSGPWSGRRGFDSLVQMSAGIADAGMAWKRADIPIPLPVQALDHATGYLMAAVTVRALARRAASGAVTAGRLSLARTARLLADLGPQPEGASLAPESPDDHAGTVEQTAWGPARRLRPPASVAGAPLRWDLPAGKLGSTDPSWR